MIAQQQRRYYAYVLYACGKFVFYPPGIHLSFICPECSSEVIKFEIFKTTITLEQAEQIAIRICKQRILNNQMNIQYME